MFLLITVVVSGWLLWRAFRPRGASLFSQRKHWSLLLAQPMVDAMAVEGFYSPACDHFTEQSQTILRAALLHQAGIRSNSNDEAVRAHFSATLDQQWFGLDLQALTATDDPRAAMAFACVRVTFLVRCALLMRWLEPDLAWRVLLLNAQRAQDCFDSWEDFGKAYQSGRKQWVATFRVDSLGEAFDEPQLRQLLAPGGGAWADVTWRTPAALNPVLAR
ncbi:DUF1266 domain-containing protein [Pseudomonas sp. TNT2022 ID642]|uniref:DUF1266 domain-containing protein n=1 Tax=Pseudomonas sp. TNT2022 ID642 TaxID=2942632 RepID=UPI0023604A1D|nr:DUF1266 domain-containing protein [Pseudomonas sp. TNT2022 ID642]MDD1001368.1 DUF1266 domain-containing protein [Pseudomonas sp. TNT2022 ID642]